MMYRRNIAQQPKVAQRAALVQRTFADVATYAVLAVLFAAGIYERAHRENRQRTRWLKRESKWRTWPACGKAARQRYTRQVQQGRLKAENGLVA